MNKFTKVFVSGGLTVAALFTVGAAGNGNTADAAGESNMTNQATQPYTSYYNGYTSYDPGFFVTDTFKNGYASGNFKLNGYETPAYISYAEEHQDDAVNKKVYDQNINAYDGYGIDANAKSANNKYNLSMDQVINSYGTDYVKTINVNAIKYEYNLNGYKIAFTADSSGTVTRLDFYSLAQ